MFRSNVEKKLETIIKQTHKAFPGVITGKPKEKPHMTILYGPELPADEKELTSYDREVVDRLYPGLMDVNAAYADLKFVGVSHFKRDVGYIIKFEFESDYLTNLTMRLREHHPAVNKLYLDAHETDHDLSRGMPPIRWLHATIGIVKDVDDVPAVEEFVRNLTKNFNVPADENLCIPTGLVVDRYVVVSAVTDTMIDVPDIIR